MPGVLRVSSSRTVPTPFSRTLSLVLFCFQIACSATDFCRPPDSSLGGGLCSSRDTASSAAIQSDGFFISIPPVTEPLTNFVAVIDLMVVYTPAARDGAGGESSIRSLIEVAVAEANTVYQNSGANLRVRAVFTGEVDYVEHSRISTNLNRLQSRNDGFMDEVHVLRDTHRADVVCLITETADDGTGGLAFTMGEPSILFKPLAFCIVKRSEAAGAYTFTHEVGHVLGCQHDRENSFEEDGTFKPGAFPFSHAHRFSVETNTFRTVMAHEPGQLVPYFSNPDLSFMDTPLGLPGTTNGANNTLTLNLTAPLVSSFYGPAVHTFTPLVTLQGPTNSSIFRAGTNLDLEIQASDVDGQIARVECFADNRLIGFATSPIATNIILSLATNILPQTNLLYNIQWNDPPNGHVQLTARAIDNSGASSASLPVAVTLRPKNDNFVDRISLTDDEPSVIGSNLAGTTEPGEAPHSGNPGGSSVWYSWRAPRTGNIRVTVHGEGILPLPDIYKSLTTNTLTTVSHEFEFDKTNSLAKVSFDAMAGDTYSIAIDASRGDGGKFTLSLDYLPPPPNDDFVNRQLLSGDSVELQSNNATATIEPNEPAHADPNPSGKSVWYQWSAPRSSTVTVVGSATNFLPIVDVYTGSNLSLLTNVPGRTIDFDVTNRTAILTFDVVQGTEYAIAVAGFASGGGTFQFSLKVPPVPANDDFANRLLLSGSAITIETSNRYAGTEPNEPPQHAGQAARRSIWYSWIAPVSGPVTVTARGAGFYPLPDVYAGDTLDALQTVPGRNIDFHLTDPLSTLTFNAVTFRTYHIVVDAFSSPGGNCTLTLNTANSPPSISSFALKSPNFVIEIRGSAGQRFVIQTSINLKEWTPLATNTFAADFVEFTDSAAGEFTCRFYRALPVP